MNTKFLLKLNILFSVFFSVSIIKAQTPVALDYVVGDSLAYNQTALWYQMNSPGSNSVTSQNFESLFDAYDSFAAEQFGLMDDIWSVTRVEVRGAYFGGTGNAESVNVWFYNDSSGYPGQVIHSSLNVIPTNGLSNGSFSIQLSNPLELTEGIYWVCVQANMSFNSSGQWGWTTSNNFFLNESAWKNPAAGFGTICTNWNYRASNCGIGTSPGLCFSLLGDIIPVELTSFTATVTGEYIKLEWETATELNNSGFEIERKNSDSNWEKIEFISGNGTTSEPSDYSYIDKYITSGKYYYRLKQLDYNGSFEYSKEVEIDFNIVQKFSLEQNYPNPFNPSTTIRYNIPLDERRETKNVTLKIYDVLGNEIATLVDEEKTAGSYEVEFNPTSSIKNPASGIYFYQLRAGNHLASKKMILVK